MEVVVAAVVAAVAAVVARHLPLLVVVRAVGVQDSEVVRLPGGEGAFGRVGGVSLVERREERRAVRQRRRDRERLIHTPKDCAEEDELADADVDRQERQVLPERGERLDAAFGFDGIECELGDGLLDGGGVWRLDHFGADRGGGALVAQRLDREHEALERDALNLRRLLRVRHLVVGVARDRGGRPRPASRARAAAALLRVRA